MQGAMNGEMLRCVGLSDSSLLTCVPSAYWFAGSYAYYGSFNVVHVFPS